MEMIERMWEDVCRVYANTMSFYIKDLSILRILVSREVLEPIPLTVWRN